MEMLPETGVTQGQKGDKKNDKLPEQTIQIMNSINGDSII